MQITVKAKSSGDKPYTVQFIFDGESLAVLCDCQAGKWGKICKHKVGLVGGDPAFLEDPVQAGELVKVKDWADKSGIFSLLGDLRDLQGEIEKLKKNEQKIRKKIENAMKGKA